MGNSEPLSPRVLHLTTLSFVLNLVVVYGIGFFGWFGLPT